MMAKNFKDPSHSHSCLGSLPGWRKLWRLVYYLICRTKSLFKDPFNPAVYPPGTVSKSTNSSTDKTPAQPKAPVEKAKKAAKPSVTEVEQSPPAKVRYF